MKTSAADMQVVDPNPFLHLYLTQGSASFLIESRILIMEPINLSNLIRVCLSLWSMHAVRIVQACSVTNLQHLVVDPNPVLDPF